jgi:hypothetical protein
MIIEVDRAGTVAGFKSIINDLLTDDQVQGILILACDANDFSPSDVDELLGEIPVPVLGGIFPEIIYGAEKLTKGTIVAGLPVEPVVRVIPRLSDMTAEYDEIIDNEIAEVGQTKTMIVLVDGLAQRISALIDSLFHLYGLDFDYIGGGAGSLSFEQKPCLFTNHGLIQDAAVLGLLTIESGIGVSHGWQRISGPYQVTEVDRNVIKSLDWQPAFDVYRQVVESASGETFTADNFFDIAKRYPFGVNKLGAEHIVRDPIVLGENGALVCVGEVPEESYVDILAGDVASLVDAAGTALNRGQAAYEGSSPPSTTLFIDCISRVLFLEDEFDQELKAVYDKQTPMIGALTLGEIANSGQDYLEFYNKTAVIGVLEV